MTMDMNVIVLSASKYDLKAEDGTALKGVSCTYLLTNTLAPVGSETALGYVPAKCSFSYESFEKFKQCPGVYRFVCDFAVSGGTGGKASIKPTDLEFIKGFGEEKATKTSK